MTGFWLDLVNEPIASVFTEASKKENIKKDVKTSLYILCIKKELGGAESLRLDVLKNFS